MTDMAFTDLSSRMKRGNTMTAPGAITCPSTLRKPHVSLSWACEPGTCSLSCEGPLLCSVYLSFLSRSLRLLTH